jgi:hypothetical protein
LGWGFGLLQVLGTTLTARKWLVLSFSAWRTRLLRILRIFSQTRRCGFFTSFRLLIGFWWVVHGDASLE